LYTLGIFQIHFKVKEENLQLVLFSFRTHSYFCIMAWSWPEFRVETVSEW